MLFLSSAAADEQWSGAIRLGKAFDRLNIPVYAVQPERFSFAWSSGVEPHVVTVPIRAKRSLWFWPLFIVLAPWRLLRLLAEVPARTPVIVTEPFMALLAFLPCLLSRKPLLLHLDRSFWRKGGRLRRRWLTRTFFNFCDMLGLFLAGGIAVVSDALKEELVRYYPTLEKRIEVLPYAVELPYVSLVAAPDASVIEAARTWESEFVNRKAELAEALELSSRSVFLLTFDEFAAGSSLEYLLRALAALEDPKLTLLVFGDGPERTAVYALVVSLGLVEQVVFLGGTKDLYEIANAVDLIVVPSGYRGMPPVFSALLGSGAAMIAPDSAILRELLSAEELLFEPEHVEALVQKLKTIRVRREELSLLREKTNRSARQHLFDWPKRIQAWAFGEQG